MRKEKPASDVTNCLDLDRWGKQFIRLDHELFIGSGDGQLDLDSQPLLCDGVCMRRNAPNHGNGRFHVEVKDLIRPVQTFAPHVVDHLTSVDSGAMRECVGTRGNPNVQHLLVRVQTLEAKSNLI